MKDQNFIPTYSTQYYATYGTDPWLGPCRHGSLLFFLLNRHRYANQCVPMSSGMSWVATGTLYVHYNIFFVQAYKLSAYALKQNKLGRNHNATPSTLGVMYFLLVVEGQGPIRSL